jgi:hypothetical protein
MMHFLLILSISVLLGFVMPRIGIRIVKDVCPGFFARFNQFVTFGFFHALEGFMLSEERTRKDGEAMELEIFKPLIGVSLLLSVGWSVLATLCSGLSTFSILSGALIASLFPTAGLGLITTVFGALRLQAHLRTVIDFLDRDPTGFCAFVDRFYDMTKRLLFNVLGKASCGK